jgi:DnaJ-class molecular chaperone
MGIRGNQIVNVSVKIPSASDLTDKQKQLLEEFARLSAESPTRKSSFSDRISDFMGR